MPKERNYNPAQAQHKADKAKAIKKGKAEQQARRNEKLAQRNPDRIQKQIDDLKAIEASGTKLTHVEQQSLEALEKDLKAVKKAREALGDKAPTFAPRRDGGGRGGYGGAGVLGKRRRDADEDDASSSDNDVPEDVKSIPMPRDTPPPIPKEVLDAWYAKRRAKRGASENANRGGDGNRSGHAGGGGGNANLEPLKENRLAGRVTGARATPTPPVEVKTVYEAKPIVRDLKKEAVSAFVPTAVRMKLDKGRGKGGLLEPEEFDRLEEEGYLKASRSDSKDAQPPLPPSDMDVDQDDHRIEHRLHQATLEEVEDEEG